MKILQAVLSFEKGGRTRRIVDLGKGLVSRGHEVAYFALSRPPEWILQKHHELTNTLVPDKPGQGLLANILGFTRLVRKLRPDVIHAHCATSRLIAAVAGRLTGIPVVGTYHHSILEPFANKLTNRIPAQLLSHAVAISSNRQQLMQDNLGIAADRVTLIHGGTEVEPVADAETRARYRAELGIDSDKLVLLSLGHLGEIKGHDHVVQAIPDVVTRFPHVHLYIGGQGTDADFARLNNLIATLQLQQHVTLLGEILPTLWYDAADVFVLASIEEGFGLVFIEAAARKLPVVATRTGGISDIVVEGETGYLVPVGDSAAIARALTPLLEDAQLRTRQGLAARKRVEDHFLLSHMVDKYLRIYQQLAGPRARET